jgi:phosphoglycolate phosphatase
MAKVGGAMTRVLQTSGTDDPCMVRLHAHLSGRSHVIWDWNGTLIDDVELCARAVAAILEAHGLPVVSVEEHRRRFRMPVREFYRALGFDLDRVSFEALAHDFVERYSREVHDCRLFEGTHDLLDRLRGSGARQAVLSAARESDLLALVDHFGLRAYFDHVCGLPDVYATTKIERGRELLRLWQVDPTQVVLVGDMDHDVDVARALGIDVLLVTGGHQADDCLVGLHPSLVRRETVRGRDGVGRGRTG